jgi:hypothetical protein
MPPKGSKFRLRTARFSSTDPPDTLPQNPRLSLEIWNFVIGRRVSGWALIFSPKTLNTAPSMKIIDYLQKQYGVTRPGDVLWSHAVNSADKLARFLKEPVMFVESDIRLSVGQGIAVAVHPPVTESDLTYTELISRMKASKQGLKLDFKDPEILIGCLEILRDADLAQPVMLNADILQGNGANISKFSAAGFIVLSKKYYPQGILSVGWTTTADPNLPYTAKNIDDMLALCDGLEEVTFPVRACLLPNSWNELQRLLAANSSWTLTVWNNEPVSPELVTWIRANIDPARTYYDFIDPNKDPMKLW